MSRYQVRVWQTCEVQWAYAEIEAESAEEAIQKVKDENYTVSPVQVDIFSEEGNKWDTAEAFEY